MKFRDDDFKKSADEEETMIKLHHMDLYDQALLDLKKLVNERNAAPQNRQRPYSMAIDSLISEIYEIAYGEDIPRSVSKQDVELALQGGKYRKLYRDPSSDIIEIDRKKKSSKAKPKRKVVKKVTKKCKCKK